MLEVKALVRCCRFADESCGSVLEGQHHNGQPEQHEPLSSSAVRESRFTGADLEEREVERAAVGERTSRLGPFMGRFEESGWPQSTCPSDRIPVNPRMTY